MFLPYGNITMGGYQGLETPNCAPHIVTPKVAHNGFHKFKSISGPFVYRMAFWG